MGAIKNNRINSPLCIKPVLNPVYDLKDGCCMHRRGALKIMAFS